MNCEHVVSEEISNLIGPRKSSNNIFILHLKDSEINILKFIISYKILMRRSDYRGIISLNVTATILKAIIKQRNFYAFL